MAADHRSGLDAALLLAALAAPIDAALDATGAVAVGLVVALATRRPRRRRVAGLSGGGPGRRG